MKILGIIPARGGSKGVPKKNIKHLCGKPLIQYTSEVALNSKKIAKVILSSDDDEIIKVGANLGLEIPFKRPTNLAEDVTPTLPVIKHALEHFISLDETFDAVCLLQVTCPLRTVDFLNEAIDRFVESGTDSLVSVQEVPHVYNPHWVFKENELGHLKIATGEQEIISRRQDLPKTYHRDGSIYLTKANVILKDNSLYGETTSFVVSSKDYNINIDTNEDWIKAEKIISNL